MFKRISLGAAGICALLFVTTMGTSMSADLENTLYLETKDGRVVIEMLPDLAPKHVTRIKELVRQKFYDGLTFHRVIDGFMVQTGDPDGDGTGGSGQNLPPEFSSEKHVSGDSQFFIMLGDSEWLDNKYSVWGRVTSGMEYVDKIKKGDEARNGTVSNPDKIVTMRVAGDIEKN